jgi:hypothetical protein
MGSGVDKSLWCRVYKQNGLGLLEIIIAVFLGSVVLMGLVGVQRLVSESSRFSFEEMQAVEEVRSGVDLLVREIRKAQPSESGSYPIEKADDQEFIFYADVDSDLQVERVRYFLDGTQIKKGVIQPTDTIPATYPQDQESIKIISDYIWNNSSPIFYYYNSDWPLITEGNPLETPSRLIETKYMRVFLRVNIDPSRLPQDFELSSGVQLRNLKTNL